MTRGGGGVALQRTGVDSAEGQQSDGEHGVEKGEEERKLAASVLHRAVVIEAHVCVARRCDQSEGFCNEAVNCCSCLSKAAVPVSVLCCVLPRQLVIGMGRRHRRWRAAMHRAATMRG